MKRLNVNVFFFSNSQNLCTNYFPAKQKKTASLLREESEGGGGGGTEVSLFIAWEDLHRDLPAVLITGISERAGGGELMSVASYLAQEYQVIASEDGAWLF